MRSYDKKPHKKSHAMQPNLNNKGSQASIETILQRYKNTLPEKESETVQQKSLQDEEEVSQQKAENKTGLPDDLKSEVENLSGYSIDDVRVHYNSDKPAQLNALAYAQGTDIHVAPGQEKHLPHEAWHVVQQKQGRVQATTHMQGIQVNDDKELEKEADMKSEIYSAHTTTNTPLIQKISYNDIIIQRKPPKRIRPNVIGTVTIDITDSTIIKYPNTHPDLQELLTGIQNAGNWSIYDTYQATPQVAGHPGHIDGKNWKMNIERGNHSVNRLFIERTYNQTGTTLNVTAKAWIVKNTH